LAGFRSRACRRATRSLIQALALAAAALAFAVAAGAASDAATPPKPLPPRDLSPAAADAVIPDVALDAKGDTVVVWAQAKGSVWAIQSVYRPAAGTWGAPQTLSTPADHVTSPQVAIAGSNVVAIWERYDGASKSLITQTADRDSATGVWSVPTSLSTSGRDGQEPRIAVNARGDTVAVWASVSIRGWTVESAYRPAGGSWQTTVPLDSLGPGTGAPAVVIDGLGVATAVWATTQGSGYKVSAATRQADGTWSKPVALSGLDRNGSITPQLALEGNNDVTAVWSRSFGSTTGLEITTKSAASGTWSPVRRLFPSAPAAVAPQIATNPKGDGVIVWTSSAPSGLSVMASVRRPGGPWGKPIALRDTGSGALAPQVALDWHGAALAVWTHPVAGNSRVQAAALPPVGSKWSTARSLSTAGADALTPQAALDTDGDGAVTWARYNNSGQSFTIQAAGYDATAPTLDKLSLPVTGVRGKRLVFSVSPKDVWSAVGSIRWSFGDGTTASGKLTSHAYSRPGRYTVQVTVSDSAGHVRSLRRTVTISAG
jgi:hypothetical protein